MSERQKFDPANPPKRRKTVIIAEELGGYEYVIETTASWKLVEIYDLVLMVFEFEQSEGENKKNDIMRQLRENFSKFPQRFLDAFALLVGEDLEIVKQWDVPIIIEIAAEYIIFNFDEMRKQTKKKGEAISKAFGIKEKKTEEVKETPVSGV